MKRIIFLALMAVGAFYAQAQSLTATLQQGDKVTPFYGENAFRDAYEAAENGALITLSTGNHMRDGYFDVRKSITIIGSGAFGEDETISYINNLNIYADDVRIEGLFIRESIEFREWVKNTRVLHCYAKNLYGSEHTNTIIDQCVIDNNNIRWGDFKNLCIKNCMIRESESHSTNATFINDAIFKIPGGNCGYATYRNCIMGVDYWADDLTLQSPGVYYNNVFFRYDDNAERKDELAILKYAQGCVHSDNTIDTFNHLYGGVIDLTAMPNTTALGDDETKVGPEGGSGFKFYPAIPRIISKKIDRQTDAEGKINVNIKVQAAD